MDSILRKGLFLVTFTGAITAFPATVKASDTVTDKYNAAGGNRGGTK